MLRTSKHLGVSWITARNMLRKIRKAMAHRDSIYRLKNIIEFDNTYVGGKRVGKKGRGAEGKTPVLVAVESRTVRAGFVAMKAVNTFSEKQLEIFFIASLKWSKR